MQNTVEKLSGNKVKISFNATATEFEDAIQKAYQKMRGQINVPGFRKGKAPRRLIESMFGKAVFYDDALEIMFPEAYMTAVRENDLKPVSRPQLDVQEMEAGKDVSFSCEIFVMPEVKLGDYKGLEVTRSIRKVADAEVDARIAEEQKRVARSVEVTDRPLANGDKAELDYSGSVDGEKFDGGTAEHQTLLIGSSSFIPGFEEQMIGMAIGQEKDLNVKFPEEYHAENLKGKDAVFHVKLHAITKEELPEADDDFAAEVSEFETIGEYRADLLKKMEEAAGIQADEGAKQSMVDAAVNNAEVEIPAPMVEDKLDEMMQQMSWRMQQQGFALEQYLKMLGQTEAQMRDMYRGEAESNVKSELVIDEIIKQEKLEADDGDVEKLLEGYTAAMGQTVEQLKTSFKEEQLDYFKHRATITKAIDLMWNAAKVKDEEITPAKAEDEEAKPVKARETKAKSVKTKEAEVEAAPEKAEATEKPAKAPRKRIAAKAEKPAEAGEEA